MAGFGEVFDGELASGCGRLNCKLPKTTQENNRRIPCLVHGKHSGQPVTQYYCLENMHVRGSKVSYTCRS